MFVPLKSILLKTKSLQKVRTVFKADEIHVAYGRVVEEVLNKKAAQNSRALFLHNKILTVAVPSSVWACHLQFVCVKIIRKINQLAGKEIIERIVFRVE